MKRISAIGSTRGPSAVAMTEMLNSLPSMNASAKHSPRRRGAHSSMMRMSFASSAWRTTMSSSMPNDACSQTDLTMKLAFFRERARLSTIGAIPPSGHGPTQSGVGSPAALMRSFARTLWEVRKRASAGEPV